MAKLWHQPDWTREKPVGFWDPGSKLIISIRKYQSLRGKKSWLSALSRKICILQHKFWSVVSGAEIDLNANIDGGLILPHPNGIVLHPKSVIGANCVIFQQVTLAGEVTLGYHVEVGAGAKILGPVTIGNHVRVGANAVVTKDIDDNCTVAGVPAVVISSNTESG